MVTKVQNDNVRGKAGKAGKATSAAASKAIANNEAPKLSALDKGLTLAAGVLQATDVLVAVPGAKAKGAERDGNGNVSGGNSHIVNRLAALTRKGIGRTLAECIADVGPLVADRGGWAMTDWQAHVARGNVVVARGGYLLDTKGTVTSHKAPKVNGAKAPSAKAKGKAKPAKAAAAA